MRCWIAQAFHIPGIRLGDALAERNLGAPSERMVAGDIEQLARSPVRFAGVETDSILEAHDVFHELGKFANRQVFTDADVEEFREAYARCPPRLFACFARVSAQVVHVGRTKVPRVDEYEFLPVEVDVDERSLDEFSNGVRLAGGDDTVVGCFFAGA